MSISITEIPSIKALSSVPTQIASGVTALSSQVAKIPTPTGLTKDDERLHIIRSRAAKTLYDNKGSNTYTSDRGTITTMKILPGPGYDPVAAVRGARSNVEDDIQSLVAGRFVNFFLTDVQTTLNEKMQIIQTFGDNEVVYYFGKQPIILNISGLLFDSLENDWFSKFLTTYAAVLRGTQLAKSFSLVQITFPTMVVTGSISGMSFNQNSNRDTDIPFQFQFVAKEMTPLPVPLVNGPVSNNIGSLIDFKANRKGVQGYSLSAGGLGSGLMEAANKTVGSLGSIGGLGSAAGAFSSTLNSFRTNIFTPIFGVISSITKIVKSVTGSITSIISSFTNPVNQVLRDINSVASQAVGVAMLIERSVNDVISIPSRTLANTRNTLRSLKNAAGTISRTPENISETFKRLHNSGRVKKGAAILSSGKARKKSKAAVLSSGIPYTPTNSNRL